tara:strand:+ start:140 stop:748 length:609 start_codon:yes stop_codon:yes gene_type:complete
MKIDVPFIKQENSRDCGSIALEMIFSYFGEKVDREQIANLVDSEQRGCTWSVGLAKASSELGFKTEFYSKSLESGDNNFELDYYKQESGGGENSLSKVRSLIKKCEQNGVALHEESLTLENILGKINEDCLAIVLLDWHLVRGIGGYHGHFVPIVGYDEKNVYIHQPGDPDPTAFLPIKRELFDEARKAEGTDEDIVLIYRK